MECPLVKKPKCVFRRRGKVVSTTLPLEMLAMVCQYLHRSPRHVFLVVKAAKGLRAFMTAAWWERFWAMHKTTISAGYRHYFLREFTIVSLRPAQMSHVLRVVYGLRCECCGARWRHRIVELMKLRMCELCVRDRFISNRVLYYRFGLNVADVLIKHGHLITYSPLRQYKRGDAEFKRLTRDLIDVNGFHGGLVKHQTLMFLWRDDVAKLYDLEACAREQCARLGAVNLLKANFRAANVLRAWDKSPRYALGMFLASNTEDERVLLDPSWVVGGPTRQCHVFRKEAEPPKDTATLRLFQRKWDMMRANVARPFLGFGEVVAKTWLEKFGGRVPPPEELQPSYMESNWRFPRCVYSVSTMQRIKFGSS